MTNEEKAKAYDELVEQLHRLADRWIETHGQAFIDVMGFSVRRLLPPRPPKVVTVKWWEAVEGLASGKFRQAESPSAHSTGVKWNNRLGLCRVIHSERDETIYRITKADFGTWRAELADV